MRVYCETFGCTMNRGDTELMLGCLAKAGHKPVSSPAEADAIIINTCAVKGPTQRRVLRRLEELRNFNGKKVIAAGCLPLIDLSSIERLGTFAGLVSCSSISSICDVVERIAGGEVDVRALGQEPCQKPCMPKLRSSKVSAIVAISGGCVSECSYCSVRFARGKLHSFSPEAILQEIESVIRAGYREILLTAQDTAAYGLDISTSLPELLEKIVSLDGKFRVKIGMMNPALTKRILPELLEVYENEKIYKFLHLPVQSGDDSVLEAMRRGYTAAQFVNIVKNFRGRFRDLYLSTDVIVGFPGEGEREFMHTCELVDETRPDNVNITRFSPMPGTEAAKMPQICGRDVKKRSRFLSKKCRAISYELNRSLVGRTVEGLATEIGEKGGYIARLPNYKPAIIPNAQLGDFIMLKIVDAYTTYLRGVSA